MSDLEANSSVPGHRRAGSPRKPVPDALILFTVFAFLPLLGVSGINAMGPDRWWWSSPNLYLPQCIWALPLLALLPFYFRYARPYVWIPIGGLLWVLGPIMGFCWHWNFTSPDLSHRVHLRVMTYNIKSGRQGIAEVLQDIRENHPDVLLFQEAYQPHWGALGRFLSNWNVRSENQYVIASHLPLFNMGSFDISTIQEERQCLVCRLKVGDQKVTLCTVHLLSPRKALVALGTQDQDADSSMHQNKEVRLEEATMLAQALRQVRGPLILTGDLNAPQQSLACRVLMDTGLRDAFAEAGQGYGYSYGHRLAWGHDYMRIDHILISPQWQATNCWVGQHNGSEHRCVIADLYLPSSTMP